MKQNIIIRLAKKEFFGYINSALAYTVIVPFLLLSIFIYTRTALVGGEASLRPYFELLPWFLLLLAPALSMKLLTDEHKSETLELLFAHPISEFEIVLGKFLGALAFFGVILLTTIGLPLTLIVYSRPDIGQLIGQYIGAIFIGATFISIGIAASAYVKNAISSFLLGASISFILIIISILLLIGFFTLASASLGAAAKKGMLDYRPLLKQLILGGGGGIILFFITSRINYKKWQTLALPIFLSAFFLTLLIWVPNLGFEHGGAKRWLSFSSFTFQPAEFLKFAFVVYISSWLAKRQQKEIKSFKTGLFPFLLIMALTGFTLIIQPDLGTLGVICFTGGFLFLLAGGKFFQIGTALFLGTAALILLIFLQPYRMERVKVFVNESYDNLGEGYQVSQAKIALGSGGLFGKGFGEGLSKFNYLPEAHGDSIFAVMAEELGFIFVTLFITGFIIFMVRGFKIARNAPDSFGRMLAAGITAWFTFQAFINIGALSGLLPLTGIPLPFVSSQQPLVNEVG